MCNRLILTLVLMVVCSTWTSCAGQHKAVIIEASKPSAFAQEDISAVAEDLSRIQFTPVTSSMPDIDLWMQRAKQRIAAAQFVVSMMYRDNMGVEYIEDGKVIENKVDMKLEMNRWLGRSEEEFFILADLSHHPSLNYTGGEDLQRGDENILSEAVQWLESAAEHGYGNSEFVLGLMYYNGVVVERNTARGKELIMRAASHHVSMAQYYIGMMYELGLDTDVNLTKSLPWLIYAAQNGSEDAKFILVMKYRDGIGVNQDLKKSEAWRKGNEKHHVWSALLDYFGDFDQVCMINYDKAEISYAYEDGCGGEDGAPWDESLSEEENERIRNDYYLHERTRESLDYALDYKIAAEWMKKAAEKKSNFYSGVLRSQTIFLSGCRSGFELDNGLMKEHAAADILDRVCVQETPDCQYYKASLLHNAYHDYESDCESDKCVHKAYAEKAFELYQKAANGGNVNAMKALGMIYHNFDTPKISYDLNVHEDLYKSFEWFEKAASSGGDDNYMLRSTALSIGDYYASGSVITDHPNLKEAVKWYLKALEYGEYEAAFILAKIYRNEEFSERDESKSIEYLRQYLTEMSKEELISMESANEAIELARKYKAGKIGAKKDEQEALKWYKLGVERFNELEDQDYDLSAYREGCAEIEKMERIKGFSSAVEQSIREDSASHSEKLIQQFRNLCKTDYDICREKLMPVYEVYSRDAVKHVIALALAMKKAGSSINDEIIKNTLYETIVYQSRVYKKRIEYAKLSKYCDQLTGASAISNDYSNRLAMYILWYLSHVSSASEAMYYELSKNNHLNSSVKADPLSFDVFLNEADEYIKKNKEAQNNYGYNFLKSIQALK